MTATPWREWQALGTAILHWPPAAFWQATPQDVMAALRGQRLLQTGLNHNSLRDLRDLLNRNDHAYR